MTPEQKQLLENWEKVKAETSHDVTLFSQDMKISVNINQLIQAQAAKTAMECAKKIKELNVQAWMIDQGYEGYEAFTTSDLQDVLELYQEEAQQQILSHNDKKIE